jgi:hypothetical protein
MAILYHLAGLWQFFNTDVYFFCGYPLTSKADQARMPTQGIRYSDFQLSFLQIPILEVQNIELHAYWLET